MKRRYIAAIIVPVLLWASCGDDQPANVAQNPGSPLAQSLIVTLLDLDTAATATVAGGIAGVGGNLPGVASVGTAGSGGNGAGNPVRPYQVTANVGTFIVDPNLVNAWGLAFNPTGPIWVAANGTGVAAVYDSAGNINPLVVTIPPPEGSAPPSAPTGLVFNSTAGFQGDTFIFASEDGTIGGWQSAFGTKATTRADNSTSGAIYKAVTLATQAGVSRLYATDFHNRKVDVWDQGYGAVSPAGAFFDPSLPLDYAPFGIQAMGATIYVTYAKLDAVGHDDVSGAGNGYVDVYDFDGNLTMRLISQGELDSPWAVALAPSDFGGLSGLLLVGNFGDGHINAYDPLTGEFVSAALDTAGAPLEIDGLWALVFGNDTPGAAHNQLFFTAGPEDEQHGAFGRLDLFP